MANKLIIKIYKPQEEVLTFPLTKDVLLETKSQFSSMGEVIPSVAKVFDYATLISAGMTGTVGAGLIETKNLFDIKRWTKTDPLIFTADLLLYTKTDPYKDVYEPAKLLIDQVILSKDNTGRFTVPGISAASLSDFQGEISPAENVRAKLVTVWIPGMLYLPIAMIESVQTTFSKEITDSGYPLWASINVNIESIMPANSDFFDDVKVLIGEVGTGMRFAGLSE